MKRRFTFVVVALLACGGEEKTTPDSVASRAFDAPAVSNASPDSTVRLSNNPCRHTGSWEACTMERRLKQAGFVLKRLDEKPGTRAGFSVKPIAYSLGSSRLEAFIYDDEKALARDMALIDTVTVAPRGSPPAWESTPMLIRSGNLAVVLLTQNPRQAERVMLAITAGAPQPGSPR